MTALRCSSHLPKLIPSRRPPPSILAPAAVAPRSFQSRWFHGSRPEAPVPEPIPLVPDVKTFLTVIGRDMKRFADKFPSWESLFSLTSPQLKELGFERTRDRRYLQRWLHNFRQGRFGPGGDFKYVRDGQAVLKVATAPKNQMTDWKWVVNVPAPPPAAPASTDDASASATDATAAAEVEAGTEVDSDAVATGRVQGYSVRGARAISGPYVVPAAGGNFATVKVTEGMWEHKRGRKIDGGERRQAETRFKLRVAARKAAREAGYH